MFNKTVLFNFLVIILSTHTSFAMESNKGLPEGDLSETTSLQKIERIGDDLYQLEVSENHFMIMERVHNSNISKWREFSKQVSEAVQNMNTNTPREEAIKYSCRSTIGWYDAILIFGPQEVWMAYISDIPQPENNSAETWISHIEMSFLVSSDHGLPFTNHMGILRNPLYKFRLHKNVSLDLHALAAKISLDKNREKIYMINAPLPSMTEIFVKALDKDSYQYSSKGKFAVLSTEEITLLADEKLVSKTETFRRPLWLYLDNGQNFVIPLTKLAGDFLKIEIIESEYKEDSTLNLFYLLKVSIPTYLTYTLPDSPPESPKPATGVFLTIPVPKAGSTDPNWRKPF